MVTILEVLILFRKCGGDDVLSLSQLTIEKAKKEIPVFHTRAMKETCAVAKIW